MASKARGAPKSPARSKTGYVVPPKIGSKVTTAKLPAPARIPVFAVYLTGP